MKKNTSILIGAAVIILLAIITITSRPHTPKVTRFDVNQSTSTNVSTANGEQIIEINAKGGYSPRSTSAKAGVATILRIKTSSTFDCSSALRIPAIGYSQTLPATGTTDIALPAQAAGSTLKALCSMGMYNFSINFNS